MKMGKAIELLVLKTKDSPNIAPDDLQSAVLLGLEALKTIRDIRVGRAVNLFKTLPGETMS
ncbi:hypothetical protein ES708_12620 [subsurface metagenome]